jgi:hypothetical protein
MECYSAIKNFEIMSFARKWMNLAIIMMTEIRQLRIPNITHPCSFSEPSLEILTVIIIIIITVMT